MNSTSILHVSFIFIIGLPTVVVDAHLIWRNGKNAMPVALSTFSANAVAMLVLLTWFRDVIALDSIMGMALRLVT
jgi:hypothetical protein